MPAKSKRTATNTRQGRSLSDRRLDLQIKKAVEYLVDRRTAPKTFREERDPERHWPDDHFLDRGRIKKRIEKIIWHIKAIDKLSQEFEKDHAYGRIDPYIETYRHIHKARERVLSALGPMHDALTHTRQKQSSKADWEQHSAVRLADGIVGGTAPRRVREVAKRIMTDAKIKPCSEEAITLWLRALRKQHNGK